MCRRAPRGARGLKFFQNKLSSTKSSRRAPRGARGLKSLPFLWVVPKYSRAPRGARGLKCFLSANRANNQSSRPARGAWIEIAPLCVNLIAGRVAPREGRVGEEAID